MIIPRKSPQVDTLSRSHHAMKHSILSAWTSMDGCRNLSDMEALAMAADVFAEQRVFQPTN